MLLQFRVTNHRSLRDEQTLSMISVGSAESGRPLMATASGERALPAVAIYGANASGKSNVLHALAFAREAVLMSHRVWEPETGVPVEPFALSAKTQEPSLYELDIAVDGVRYRYGFELSAKRIEREWLFAWPNRRRQMLFDREGDTIEFGENLRGENATIRQLTRANSLFLSAAAQNNHEQLRPIYRWFARAQLEARLRTRSLRAQRLVGARPGLEHRLVRALDPAHSTPSTNSTSDLREAILRIVKAADVGIVDLRVEMPADEETSRPPKVLVRHDATDEGNAWLPLEAESAGTIRLLDLSVPLITALQGGGLICIDELERSLHPAIALELVRLFNSSTQNAAGAQLLFTTHDTNLLGRTLGESPLHRDQIWFTEKDLAGATHLYPLTDFHPRAEENMERGYLQGRYGAIPFLGQLEAAMTKRKAE